jgi:hypothetical protein
MSQSFEFVSLSTASPVPNPFGNPLENPSPPDERRDGELPRCLDFLFKPRRMLDVRFDPASRTVWCAMRHENTVSWTLPLLQEINALNADLRAL